MLDKKGASKLPFMVSDFKERYMVIPYKAVGVDCGYLEGIRNPSLTLPHVDWDLYTPVWHIFAVRTSKRDELAKYLEEKDIHTNIHYPIAMHNQQAYQELGIARGSLPVCEEISDTQLSLPMYYGMKDEVDYVIQALNDWQ